MSLTARGFIIDRIMDSLDVPDSAYESAKRRYEDLGEWLHDENKAICAQYSPHIFAQGSFRLGTVTKPWKREDYDLDLACKLEKGISKKGMTQKQFKNMIGEDLEKYRQERGIKKRLEEKHRCWRLNYQDALSFHMDIVPCIPETIERKKILLESVKKSGVSNVLAQDLSEYLVAITDNQLPSIKYDQISTDWPVSNQEGYALWFKERMSQKPHLLEARAAFEKVARMDDLPVYKWKMPLQRCIQILKRHRDVMFEKDCDNKPISAIINTLAAQAYQGEEDIESAMNAILNRMGELVKPSFPKVPNPVNPEEEDFADKWPQNQNLEKNFWIWLKKIKEDFGILGQIDNIELLTETTINKFGAKVDESAIALFKKGATILSGTAHTAANGTIGVSGVKNNPHKFYGNMPH